MRDRSQLQSFAWLSVLTAVGVIVLKLLAWKWTGSVGLLSDALESGVNLAAALATVAAVAVAARPPDDDHAYGHDKIEFFASGFEGALIVTAAVGIFWTAVPRLFAPETPHALGPGLALSALASGLNLLTARVLLRTGRERHSPALTADGHHLMSDVWSSIGVLAGMLLVWLTGWPLLDPLIALAVACYIVVMGVRLVREAASGLLDRALPEPQRKAIDGVLEAFRERGVDFHAIRTRSSGARQFVSLHVLVPDEWSVRRGHDLVEQLEDDLRAVLPAGIIFTHMEPLNDPKSWEDQALHR
ncbi:MAG: cation transporter [Verrucomicrobiales bacterium]|nr:cation transporter [Verrucomicrobiales bacterium]